MFYLGDCLEGMKNLSKESVDAVVTSPPYNLDIKYSKYKDKKPRDQYLGWIGDVFLECKRVLKEDGHLFVNVGYSNLDATIGLEVMSAIKNAYFKWKKNDLPDFKNYERNLKSCSPLQISKDITNAF